MRLFVCLSLLLLFFGAVGGVGGSGSPSFQNYLTPRPNLRIYKPLDSGSIERFFKNLF